MEEKINIKYIDVSNIEYYGDTTEFTDKEYTIDDCVLVRTTDIFPFNGVVQTPINGNAVMFGDSNYLADIIHKKVSQKYLNRFADENEYDKYNDELDEFRICYKNFRSTIHFCINGLVGNHAYGNFSDRQFIILEPLKYHIDDSLKSLRVGDTYFNDDMKLSNESVILISEDQFNIISKDLEYLNELKKFKIYVFKGDEQIVVKEVLKELGYDSFAISSHGYVNGTSDKSAAAKMYKFISNYANQNNIGLESHYYSEIRGEDNDKLEEHSQYIDDEHILYLLDNSNVKDELKNQIKLLVENKDILYRENLLQEYLEEFVNLVGLERIKELTKEFNDTYINSLNNNKKNTF